MSEFLLLFLLFVCLFVVAAVFVVVVFGSALSTPLVPTLPPSPVTQDRPFRMPEVRKGGGGGGGGNAGRLPSEGDTAPPPSHLGGVH